MFRQAYIVLNVIYKLECESLNHKMFFCMMCGQSAMLSKNQYMHHRHGGFCSSPSLLVMVSGFYGTGSHCYYLLVSAKIGEQDETNIPHTVQPELS